MLRFLCDRNRHRAGWRFLCFTMIVTVKKSAGAEKRLDNSPSMPYNNYCCAGVAHLVERDLAKVEVASSSLVARSKKKDTRRGVFLFGAALLLRKSGRLRAGDLTCKGNPTKVSLAYIPFLAIYRSAHGQQNLWAITKRTSRKNLKSFSFCL